MSVAETDELRRHLVRDVDEGHGIMRVLSFVGMSNVRVVFEVELQRDGLTLHREEAEALRDALTEALAEIDAHHAAGSTGSGHG